MIDLHISARTLEELNVTVDRFDLMEAALIPWMIERLEERGYMVHVPHVREKPTQIMNRLGISNRRLHHALNSTFRPEVKVKRGETGRIIWIASNAAFDAFCKNEK